MLAGCYLGAVGVLFRTLPATVPLPIRYLCTLLNACGWPAWVGWPELLLSLAYVAIWVSLGCYLGAVGYRYI